ncbi:hypothetical protein [Lacipirellula sp.]|uniref:hypothetical protein n=1 Tax=Lacipirellula sp. TaxID=2691419 RepID=UPI003D0A4DB5
MLTLGEKLIAKFARRQMMGAFFTYQQYQELHAVRTQEEMRTFLDACGYCDVIVADDPQWLADGIQEAHAYKEPPWWTQETFGIVALPLWLLWRVLSKPRQFPRRSRYELPAAQFTAIKAER